MTATKIQSIATLVRFVHFRQDGRIWVIDLELEDGHTWTSYGTYKTKKSAIHHLEIITGARMQFGPDRNVGWF